MKGYVNYDDYYYYHHYFLFVSYYIYLFIRRSGGLGLVIENLNKAGSEYLPL